MLATVLAQPARDAEARVRVWRQVVDLLAQGRAGAIDRSTDRAYEVARAMRPEIPLAVRAAAAQACLDRRVPARLVGFFAEEVPEIAGPLLSQVQLRADEWLSILPDLSVFAKGQLRAREDLPPELAYPLGVALAGQDPDADLDDLIARMEARRAQAARLDKARTATTTTSAAPRAEPQVAIRMDSFRFTTDEEGVIAVRGPAPEGISGVTIAAVACSPDHGVDGHAAGAWRRRAAFTDARLSIAGAGQGAGQWRISGEPCFAAPDGRFVGYAGEARRPRIEESSPAVPLPPDPALAQAQEEERAQTLLALLKGPLDLAGSVVPFTRAKPPRPITPSQHALRLLDGIEGGKEAVPGADDRLDAAAILTRLHAACHPGAEERGVRLSFRIAAGLPPIAADPAAVERMFTRLLAATLGLARRGECVAVRVGLDRRNGSLLALSLSRPGALAGLDEHSLLAPLDGKADDAAEGSRMALSFAIRLVRNLAGEAGGRLDIGADRIVLSLPLAASVAGAAGEG